MKWTQKRLNEKDLLLFFNQDKSVNITDKDYEDYFSLSEKGIKPKEKTEGFLSLENSKRWRGIHMEMYEEGVLEGSMPYFIILGGYDKTIKRKFWEFWKPRHIHNPLPRRVVDFMKKEMFKGTDSEIIEKTYQSILKTL